MTDDLRQKYAELVVQMVEESNRYMTIAWNEEIRRQRLRRMKYEGFASLEEMDAHDYQESWKYTRWPEGAEL